jgi:hypothetical protein
MFAGDAREHVFLVGFPRSGTTLLEQVLASHPDVVALEEQDTLAEATKAYLAHPSDVERLPQASPDELAHLRADYWERVRRFGAQPQERVFVDKLPLNTLKLPVIARLFPRAKILFAWRDPRDVVLSCFRRRFKLNPSMYQLLTLEGAADFYDAVMGAAHAFRQKLPLTELVVRHERLVDSFDREARAVCDFLGLEWSDAVRDFADRTLDRAINTPSAAQLGRGLSSEGVGHWRNYSVELAPVLPVLNGWAERFGYPVD